MRYRTRNSLKPPITIPREVKDDSCSASSWRVYLTSGTGIEIGEVEEMWDRVTPDFVKRSKQGAVFFNPMRKTLYKASSSGGIGPQYMQNAAITCTPSNKNPRFRIEVDYYQLHALRAAGVTTGSRLPVGSLISNSDIADASREVSTSVLAQRGRSSSNLYESLAEANQALGTIGSISDNINDILSRVPKNVAKGITGGYLLYRYGIKPLVSDIDSVMKSLGRKAERVRETSRSSLVLNRSDVRNVVAGEGTLLTTSLIQTTDRVTLRAMSLDEYITSQAFEAGFSSKGLLTLPLELVPYSFVIDWFVNVGDFINSIVPTPGFTNLGSCLSLEREITTQYTALSSSIGSGYTLERPVIGSCVASSVSKDRGSLAQPGLVLKSDFRLSNLTRAADAVSLVIQKLISLRGR